MRQATVQIRLSDEEKHAWELRAFQANQSLSDYIRDALEMRRAHDEGAQTKKPEDDLPFHLKGWAKGNLQHHLIFDHEVPPHKVPYDAPMSQMHAEAHANPDPRHKHEMEY